ncbi:MAG: energy-coupling factor transporter transmembrane component T, partial [Clostridia bacterium]|nr:energy-coupling factor transporter transmembrane component T [Clostridia bacterium]
AYLPVLIPLFLSAFRRADQLALAMEARCYRGGQGRTRMRQLKWEVRDTVAVMFCAGVLVAVIAHG